MRTKLIAKSIAAIVIASPVAFWFYARSLVPRVKAAAVVRSVEGGWRSIEQMAMGFAGRDGEVVMALTDAGDGLQVRRRYTRTYLATFPLDGIIPAAAKIRGLHRTARGGESESREVAIGTGGALEDYTVDLELDGRPLHLVRDVKSGSLVIDESSGAGGK